MRIKAKKISNGLEYTFSEVDLKNMSATVKAGFVWESNPTPPPAFVTESMEKVQAETTTDNKPVKGRKKKEHV